MPKIPRDISGLELAKLLSKYGYNADRQKGSHIRLSAKINNSEHHITIPDKDSVKIGTLNNIILNVAEFLGIDKKELIKKIF
ncbi:MAG: type II toxin-antitoxin system HicA family toxin [Candidatus Acididesulfobacter diazotrophicus]|jgi:predicted RNA binding protein YcfA (HicA-like mRNA interferase family)|uniref:Type II toxin-antitoxin system HicA family toxin n=1 Tax=Candidatus Acididesulfobacter diazotrophicus TaxID=2597226 RepID=A0A519BNB5_9DELT|nr:MAG: type II toxin-antitoxin system HicA family toxin [Candidatus Acididesulfobacter diazotrophicus]